MENTADTEIKYKNFKNASGALTKKWRFKFRAIHARCEHRSPLAKPYVAEMTIIYFIILLCGTPKIGG